ncbi:MAG: MFS transporter [Chloroflexota bacterium]|nr:MFS transporter [Chloroflexota bacterium]MDE2683604.1 MFS transporter [Chloroflexota bacterium]
MRIRSVPVLVVLQDRNFQFLWAARWIHEISRRMELIVLGYLILELTGSAFAVGLISVFLNGPRPPLALVAGMLADRLDRWRILVGMHTVYLFIAAGLLVLLIYQLVEPWHVFLAILLQGTAKVLDDPTRRAALFDLAGQDRIAHAMSLETITNNGGKIIGPMIGGFMVQFYGFTGAFIVLVALDLVAVFLIFKMRLPEGSAQMVRDTAFWSGIKSGIGHSFSNKFVLGVLTISLVMNGMILPLQYFIPVVATDVLKVGPALGGILGAADGIGAFVGAIIIGGRSRYTFHGRYFVIGALVVGIGVAVVAWSPWFAVSFLVLLCAGMGQSGFSVMQSTILLLSSPAEMRGRIMGSQGLVNGLGHLIGGVEIGAIAQAFTISLAIGINAGVGILFMLPVILLTPLVWRPVEAYRHPEAGNSARDGTDSEAADP